MSALVRIILMPGLQSWDGPIGGFFPVISKNITDATVVVGTVTWQPLQMVNHPGPNGEYSVLRWTAPKAGEVEVSASFSGADSTTTDVHVLFNETTIAGCDGNVNGFGPGPTCSKTLVVEIGDTIDFVVGIGNGIGLFQRLDRRGRSYYVCGHGSPDPTPEIDLSVTISDSPDPVAPAGNITYTITVTNDGPRDATNVTLTDAVPANTAFVSFTPLSGGTSTTPAVGGGGTITSTTSSLAAGASASFILVVQVSPSADAGAISNSASVSGNQNDPNTANNTANTSTTVPTAAHGPCREHDRSARSGDDRGKSHLHHHRDERRTRRGQGRFGKHCDSLTHHISIDYGPHGLDPLPRPPPTLPVPSH